MPMNFAQRNVNYLSDSLGKNLELATVQRGWELYRKQAAISLQQLGSLLKARVRDDNLYEIALDSDFFEISSCTCQKKRNCEHMAAAFFLLLELQGVRPESFLQMCQSKASRSSETKPAEKSAEKPAEKPAAAAPTKSNPPQPTPKPIRAGNIPKSTDSADSWLQYFEAKAGKSFTVLHMPLGNIVNNAKEKLIHLADGWPDELQKIYLFFFYLFIVHKTEQHFQSPRSKANPYSFFNHQHSEIATNYLEKCIEVAQELRAGNAGDVYPEHYKSMIRFLEQHAFPIDRTPVDWLGLYRLLWGGILYRPEWAKREQLRLHQALEVKDLHPKRRDFMICAIAHFDFMVNEDKHAIARLDKIQYAREPESFYIYVRTRLYRKEWDKLLLWMRWLVPGLKHVAPSELLDFMEYWREAADQQDDAQWQAWADIMISLFPQSYPYYANYLSEQESLREWVDLALYCGHSPLDLYRDDLREVEKEDLHLLLPLYTQAAERYIMQKNRSSYRMAVKMMSSLQAIYKRLKKLDQWQAYYRHIVNQYSRFRAFQEELAKGKWIS
jgi:hypothetical protein